MVTRRLAFLKISQNSERNTCAAVSVKTIKGLQVARLAALLKKDHLTGVSEPFVRTL